MPVWSSELIATERERLRALLGVADGPTSLPANHLLASGAPPRSGADPFLAEYLFLEASFDLYWWTRDRDALPASELEKLCVLAEKILVSAGILRGESKLDYLYDPIDAARAAAWMQARRWEEALWLVQGMRRRGKDHSSDRGARLRLIAAKAQLRLGNAALARRAADEVLASAASPHSYEAARLVLLEALRVRGDLKGLTELAAELATGDGDRALRWELFKSRHIAGSNDERFYREAARELTGNPGLIEARLQAFADAAQARTAILPTVASIQRRILWEAGEETAHRPLLRAVKVLEDAYDRRIPLALRVAACGKALEQRAALASVEQELTLLAALLRWCRRSSQNELGEIVQAEYGALGLRLSDGTRADLLGLDQRRRGSAVAEVSADDLPRSALGRTSRLVAAGAAITSQEIALKAASLVRGDADAAATRMRQARILVDVLGSMKGAAMKAGQMLSIELSDLLPPEVSAVLSTLYDDSTTMTPEAVRRLLAEELGDARLERITALSPEPVASASIGQVHRATIDGREVAIKVQFPGVAATVRSDLSVVRHLSTVFLKLQGRPMNVGPILAELEDGFIAETDYRREAENLEIYRAKIKHPAFVVPTVVREFSTGRVLVMSFEEGMRLKDWMAESPTAAERQHVAELICELMTAEVVETGLVQSDPNLGNFLYRPDDGRLVLLDLGATVRYPLAMRREFVRVMKAALDGDAVRFTAVAQEIGFFDAREPDAAVEAFRGIASGIAAIFSPQAQPFPFGDTRVLDGLRKATHKYIETTRYVASARRVVALGRKVAGMYHLLQCLDVRVDTRRLYERMCDALATAEAAGAESDAA